MMRFRAAILASALLLSSLVCGAQMRWVDPLEAGAQVHNQGWPELNGTYSRLPDKAQAVVRDAVWGLSRNSAGLSIVFRSNAPEISVSYKVAGGLAMYHMPSTGTSGIDLYATDVNGGLRWCAPNFTAKFTEDEIRYDYSSLTYHPEGSSYEYHLYLPPYNTVEWLKIGVPEGADLEFLPESSEKPIVLYGTSIAQGACASRPGNAWPNIVEREMARPLVNLGFSGNGLLEPEVFRLLAEIDACVYIIDCMPNMCGRTGEIFDRTVAGVRILRQAHDCPILLVEHSGYANEFSSDSRGESYKAANRELWRAYLELLFSGVKDIHYLTHDETGLGMDGMVEGVHPNDFGMRNVANAFENKLKSILK
ncbi:MAG: SGNH/GDSL hydrolase family protein [Bacteroidales bacterium]|nr:SGNH/GDSL hydrolase family protein [Bacteroidales bacterium]